MTKMMILMGRMMMATTKDHNDTDQDAKYPHIHQYLVKEGGDIEDEDYHDDKNDDLNEKDDDNDNDNYQDAKYPHPPQPPVSCQGGR